MTKNEEIQKKLSWDNSFSTFGFRGCFGFQISDFLLGGRYFPKIKAVNPDQSARYLTFSTTIIVAVTQARACSHRGETNWPIFLRLLVNKTSGITANESCILRMT